MKIKLKPLVVLYRSSNSLEDIIHYSVENLEKPLCIIRSKKGRSDSFVHYLEVKSIPYVMFDSNNLGYTIGDISRMIKVMEEHCKTEFQSLIENLIDF